MLILPDGVFTLLRDMIHDRCGLHYEVGKRDLFEYKLAPRVAARGLGSFLDYYYLLRDDVSADQEWQLLLDSLGLGAPKPEAVVVTLQRKIREHPELESLRYVLVVVLTRLGRYAEAREELLRTPELADHPDLRQFVDHLQELAPPAQQGEVAR